MKVKYTYPDEFMFECARLGATPLIHWRDDDIGVSGFIYFKVSGEVHIFYSKEKKLLDAIWHSIGLIKRAAKLVNEV